MEGRTVDVTVISATELRHEKKFGQSQKCFAVVHIYPAVKQTTEMDHYGGVNPTWNAKLPLICYEAHLHPPSSNSYNITVEIFCKHSLMGHDKVIGTVTLPLADLPLPNEKGNSEPFQGALTVTNPSGETEGTLNLIVKVGPKRVLEPHEDPSASKTGISGDRHHQASSSSGSGSRPPAQIRHASGGSGGDYSKGSSSTPSGSEDGKADTSAPKHYHTGGASSSQEDFVTGYPVQRYPAFDPLAGHETARQLPQQYTQARGDRGYSQGYNQQYSSQQGYNQGYSSQQQGYNQGYSSQQGMEEERYMEEPRGRRGRKRGGRGRRGRGRGPMRMAMMIFGGPVSMGVMALGTVVGKLKEHHDASSSSDARVTAPH